MHFQKRMDYLPPLLFMVSASRNVTQMTPPTEALTGETFESNVKYMNFLNKNKYRLLEQSNL